MFPRASWSNLLASSPAICLLLQSSATAVEPLATANRANATAGAGLLGSALMVWDGAGYNRALIALALDTVGNRGGFPAAGVILADGASNVYGLSTSSTSSIGDGASGRTHAATSLGLFNGTGFDRARGSTDSAVLTGGQRVIPVACTFANITTNATTTVKNAPGVITGLVINTAGTTSTVILKDNATVIGTFTTTAQDSLPFDTPIYCATTIVAVTAGAAAADITVLYR